MRYRSDSAQQKYKPPVQTLCTIVSGAGADVSVSFRIPVPDSRLRVKVSLMYIPPAGDYPTTLAGVATLWLAEAEDDDSGVSGLTVPCTNIEGTAAAPTSIPAANGLLGYSREFVSAGDNIQGVFTVTPGVAMAGGSWVLQTRYQPESVRFTPEEWNEITAQCNPQLTSPRVTRA